jgi:hypothetical protein
MRRIALAVIFVALVASVGSAAPSDKVTICHIPPGNPRNAHTIVVAESAVPAHLAHGDSLGACTTHKSPPD